MESETLRIPLTAAAGGAAALALRAWNLRVGFEADTGLPLSGASFPALSILLGVVALSLIVQARRLSQRPAPRFPFRTERPALLLPAVAGAFLLALSGAADVFEGATGQRVLGGAADRYAYSGLIGGEVVGMSGGVQCFIGLLTLLSAWAAFDCARACLRGRPTFRAAAMIPAVALSVRLVTVYRIESVNPVLQEYAPALLALVVQILGFYHFSAFAFDYGSLTAFAASAGGAVCMALCVLADKSDYVSTPLTLCGSAAALAGFLLSALQAPPAPGQPAANT